MFQNFNATLDVYQIDIDDRIGAIDTTVDQAAVDELVAAGYPDAELLLNTAASYFSNASIPAFGVDLILSSVYEPWAAISIPRCGYNHNDQEVKNIKPGTINASRAYDSGEPGAE
jgi:hypothetical protein